MKTLIGAICCFATVLCQAADGTLTVSGTVNWSDTTNWKDGIVAGDGGNASINGSGTVNVDVPVSLKGVGVTIQNGTELTIAGSKITLAAVSGNSTFRIDEGKLFLAAPVEYNSDLELFGSGTLFPCTPMTSPGRKRLYLRDAQLSLDFSRAGEIVENLLPNAPLFVNGYYSSLLRMGGSGTSHKQEFSSYDLNAPFTVGGSGTLKSSAVRGVNGLGALTVGQYDYDTVVFQAADLFTRYFGAATVQGKARIRLQPLPAASTTLPVTSGCLFHVDASAAATLTTEVRNGETVVTRWADASGGGNAAVAPDGAQAAVLRTNALNGLPVVDFGPATGNGGMEWVNSLSGIRDVFIVIGSQRGGGTLLGTKQAESNYLYERGRNIYQAKGSSASSAALYTLPLTRDTVLFYNAIGSVYLNGDSDFSAVNAAATGLSGEYDLVELVGNQDGTASAFARRAGLDASKRVGREAGQALAEVVIYNRNLSESERREVEAYLMKKWFSRERRGFGAAAVENITISPPAGWHDYGLLQNAVSKSPVAAKVLKIAGNGTSYYTVADADNIVADRADIGRKLRLMGGKFTLTARQTSATLPGPQPAFHVDATTGVETDGSGISKWADASGGTVYAVPEDGYKPTLVANGLNGKSVVDFGSVSSCQHLRWSSNIVVRTCFFVMKLANNHVSFLGSSCPQMNVVDNFTRFQNTSDYIYNVNNGVAAAEGNIQGGLCYLDGVRVPNPAMQKFGTAFKTFAHVLEGGLMANAFGCGAYESTNHRAERTGGLQIAEAIIYDRRLTEDECLDVQAYLRWKWFGETLAGYAQPGEPYTICSAGSGSAGSVLTVRGTAPATVSELFGGADLKLSAPETTVSIPAVQGTLTLSNATVSVRSDLAAGKLLFSPGTTNSLVAGAGTIASFGVKGVLDARNGASPTVTSLTFDPGTSLLLGVNSLDVHALTIGDGVSVFADVNAEGKSGVVNACDLAVAGTGSITLGNVGNRANPVGVYAVMTFGSLSAEGAARLRNWEAVVPGLPEKFRKKVTVSNNAVNVRISSMGLFLVFR